MNSSDATLTWYAQLVKPSFAPPSWVFGPAWSVLYVLMAVSFCFVFYTTLTGKWPKRIAIPFVVNLIANLAYSPIQFRLQNNVLALFDILIVLLSIPWLMLAVWPRARWVTWMQVPYLLWVIFATILQISITWLNS